MQWSHCTMERNVNFLLTTAGKGVCKGCSKLFEGGKAKVYIYSTLYLWGSGGMPPPPPSQEKMLGDHF